MNFDNIMNFSKLKEYNRQYLVLTWFTRQTDFNLAGALNYLV